MDLKNELNLILDEHEKLKTKYQKIIQEVKGLDYINENEKLIKEKQILSKRIAELESGIKRYKNENDNLRVNLREQILDEKLGILKESNDKNNVYFASNEAKNKNKLKQLEYESKRKLLNLEKRAKTALEEDFKEFDEDFRSFENKINERVLKRNAELEKNNEKEKLVIDSEYEKLKSEGVSEDVIKKRIRDNNLEIKIGLKTVSIIGIILILIGISTGLKYAYTNFFSVELKGAMVYLVGILFLLTGEFFYRKQKEIFSFSLVGGGTAILYISTFYSYFSLEIISMNVALIISIVITLITVFLSIRFNSKVIISISLVGGYLPFFTYVFSFGLDGDYQYLIASLYLMILNLLIIIISSVKRWISVNYISFILNVPSMLYIVFSFENELIGIGVVLTVFLLYLTAIMINPVKFEKHLSALDIVLLGFNTLISCISTYSLLYQANLDEFDGLMAVLYFVIYLLLTLFTRKFLPKEKSAKILFLVTSYTFIIIAVPFQFGIKWFSLGWLIEGILLILYGNLKKIKHLEITGWIISVFCYLGFLFIDTLTVSISSESIPYYHLRYSILILGMLGVMSSYFGEINSKYFKNPIRTNLIKLFKYFTILNVWVYFLVEIIAHRDRIELSGKWFLTYVVLGLATLLVAYLIKYVPFLKDKVTNVIANIFIVLVNIEYLILTIFNKVDEYSNDSFIYTLLVIVVVLNIYMFISIRKLLIDFLRVADINIEYYTVIICIYLLLILNRILSFQFNLGDLNLLFSIIYIVAAFVMIIFGFKRKYVVSRRFGLLLSIFSTGKLFVYDLSFLNLSGKIISYLTFGFVLLGISYMYQKFSKQFDEITKERQQNQISKE
jgi:uncharacterized membrane protein